MSATFTFKAPDEATSREVYHQFFHALRRTLGRASELTLLWNTEDALSRSFALANGEESDVRRTAAAIDLRGCEVVIPAEEQPVVVVEAPPVVEEVPAESSAVEETVAEEPVAAAPVSRRGRRSR